MHSFELDGIKSVVINDDGSLIIKIRDKADYLLKSEQFKALQQHAGAVVLHIARASKSNLVRVNLNLRL